MVRTAFSTAKSLFNNPTSLLPVDFTTGAFERVLGLATPEEAKAEGGSGAAVNFWLFLRNSLIFATVATTGQVFFSALAAYAFARLRWPGRDKVFFLFLTALMVPPIFTMLPNFILIKNLHLLNTFPGLIAPYFFMTPFAIFYLRQFFLGINREIEEAAKLDGAGHWRIFFRIILPMSSAPIVTLFILTFINMWNDYFWPFLVATNEQTRVLTVAIGVFRSQTPAGSPDWAGLMAAVLVAALPILILFMIFAKKVVNSIGFSGVK
jgi:multiple sugar transport system permease protein